MGHHQAGFAPLEKEGATYNPACLKCHVTGFEKENGFWDIETSRDMAGIQCEQCHGPLAQHVKEENSLTFSSPGFGGMGGETEVHRRHKPHKTRFHICSRCHADDKKLQAKPEEAWKSFGHSKQ
jgi:hypothetical protein